MGQFYSGGVGDTAALFSRDTDGLIAGVSTGPGFGCYEVQDFGHSFDIFNTEVSYDSSGNTQ